MQELTKSFNFNGHGVRVITNERDQVFFVAKDICDILGYSNTSKAISDNCKKEGITTGYIPHPQSETKQIEVTLLNEGNLYRLVLKSKKKESEVFESWVCDEVLPSIRKTGKYESKPKTQIEILLGSVQMLAEQEQRLSSVEFRLNQIEETKQLALNELNYIERSAVEVPEIGIRLKINQIVRSYSERTKISYADIWRSMYSKMLYSYRFNVNGYKKLHEKESKMDIVERENQLDNLFALVSRELI